MTAWNRSYLEAMSIPVWVARQAETAVADQPVAEEAIKPQANAKPEQSVAFSFVSVAGNLQAKACILVTAEQDLQLVRNSFQLLTQAWKQWQGTDLPLALLQLIDEDSSVANTKPIIELKNKRLLVSTNQTFHLPGYSTEQAPGLNWQSANDKKAWWQLLQTLA